MDELEPHLNVGFLVLLVSQENMDQFVHHIHLRLQELVDIVLWGLIESQALCEEVYGSLIVFLV